MNPPAKPTLEESAGRNPGVTPDRVQKMQEVVKQLHDRGVLKPSKYGIQSGLAAPRAASIAASHDYRMMNRVGENG